MTGEAAIHSYNEPVVAVAAAMVMGEVAMSNYIELAVVVVVVEVCKHSDEVVVVVTKTVEVVVVVVTETVEGRYNELVGEAAAMCKCNE